MQVRTAQRNAASKRQSASVNVVRTVRLDEIRKTAGTANAGDGRDLLMPQLALFNQFEVKREDREITTTGAPCRVIGRNFFLGQTFTFASGQASGRNSNDVIASWNFSDRIAHI